MIRNYLKIAFRSLVRSKTHSIINISGLSLGIGACLLIVLFVNDELTFDLFHSKAKRIYRVYFKEDYGPNQQFFNTVTPYPMGPALKDNFPEVEAQVRIQPVGTLVKRNDANFRENITVVGQKFFDVFDFELVTGDRQQILDNDKNLILTESTARKYFGENDPIGKVLSIQLNENFEEFTVAGIAKDPPTNSSITFTFLISDLNFTKFVPEALLTSRWFNVVPETYLILRPDVSAETLVGKFPNFIKATIGEEDFKASKYTVGLQPMTSIHLDNTFPVGSAPVSDPKYSYILGAIAILILVVACINFVTLSIGRSLKRAKEVGIRKVVGAERRQLILQFIGEAVIVTTISMMIGIALAGSALPLFNDLAGKQLIFPLNSFMAAVISVMLVIIGLIAGSYPAFVLSAFKPASILKGGSVTGNNRQSLRKALVGVQLVLSTLLISCTLIMREQLEFLRNANLGFDRDQLMVVNLNAGRGNIQSRIANGMEKAQLFKSELAKFQTISSVSAATHDFGNGGWMTIGFADDAGVYRNTFVLVVDEQYIPTMKMEMVSGRNYAVGAEADKRRGVLVNEAFVKQFGWANPLGERIPKKQFEDHEIIGVVKDFNFNSLYTRVEPLIIVMNPAFLYPGIENISFDQNPSPKLFVRLKAGTTAQGIKDVENTWNQLAAGEEFTFNFVDQALDAQYRSDQNLGRIVRVATFIAILIGSLGLYGLASLSLQNRTKEISIRKVMGATEQSLLVLLSREYLVLIGLCLLISIPVTIYMMTSWLSSFQYRVDIGWLTFALSGGISVLIAIFTIGYQTLKVAWTQPAQALKYE